MASRTTIHALAAGSVAVTLLLLHPPAAEAQRKGKAPAAAPKLTEETLVPEEVFPASDARRFGYADGVEVVYSLTPDGNHVWKLTEPSAAGSPSATPPPSPESPGAPATPGSPDAPVPPVPPADPGQPTPPPIAPGAQEAEFLTQVAFLRPSFATLRFTQTPEDAAGLVQAFFDQKSDEVARPANLGAVEVDRDPKVAPDAVVYKREFNLGAKSGGVRRGATIVLSRGRIFVRIDAFWGLRDGSYEAELNTLEKRARDVAAYLLRKI